MTIPLATTTISISRVTDLTDGYDASPPAAVVIASNVRAVVGAPSASTRLSGGQRVVYTATLRCDPTDVQAGDTVTSADGTEWFVLWARQEAGVGLTFTMGELRLVTGAT